MARSIPVIYNQLLAAKNAQSVSGMPLNPLNSTSQVSKWNLWLWITAVSQNLFEQLCDLFQANIEATIANAPVYSPQWIVAKIKQFQYSTDVAQLVALDTTNFTINYPTTNPTYQIIAQAAVEINSSRSLTIKVASLSGSALVPAFSGTSDPIYLALISYINTWMIPGTQYSLVSLGPDIVYIEGSVWFDASYSGVIEYNMVTAINGFLSAIPFDGTFTVSGLEETMLNVGGVEDVELTNVWVQTNAEYSGSVPPPGVYLVQAKLHVNRYWQTYAGYAISVPSGTYQLSSTTITYTPV